MPAEAKEDVVTQTLKPSIHRRILPYYLDNYVKQRPVIVSTSSASVSLSRLPEERRPETCSLPLRGVDYSQTNIAAVNKSYANTHRCPPGEDMCELCQRHFAKKQPDGYETFLNHVFTYMAHRPALNQNAKQRYIIQKPHPHLPVFVFSKFLHPKIFWREIRKPRERTHQKYQGSSRTPKSFHYQRTYRTVFNRCPNSPETNLDSTGRFDRINLQFSDDSDTNDTKRKSVGHSKSRKKKIRPKSSKEKQSKSESKEKDKDSQAVSDEEFTDSDREESLAYKNTSSQRGIVKKERKQRIPERIAKEGNEEYEYTASDEDLSNIPEKNGNEENVEIKIEMKPPSLPRYHPKPPTPMIRNTNKQKMFLPSKQQPENTPDAKKNPPKSMSSYFGQPNKENNTNNNKLYSWLQRQLDISLHACRFELPIDGRILESMMPEDYLRRYCIVTPQFQSLYQKVFRKYQCPQMMRINFKDLETALRDVAVNHISDEKMEFVQTMTGVGEQSCIDYKLFCAIAALTERVSSVQTKRWEILKNGKEEHMLKEIIETADFSALDWKLKDIDIGDKMKLLLGTICS